MDIDQYRLAGHIAKRARDYGSTLIKEDVLLLDVANAIEDLILDAGAKPAFPVNISINDVAAHYSPFHNDSLRFRRGDVVKLDVGVHVDGYIGDTATTVEVGTRNWQELIVSTQEALSIAIELVGPGCRLGLLCDAIDRSIRARGYTPVRNLTGHSLGRYTLHAGLSVPNVPDRGADRVVLEAGDAIAIEPFATDGTGRVRDRGWGDIFALRGGALLPRLFSEGGGAKPFKGDIPKREHPKDSGLLSIIQQKYGSLPFAGKWCIGYVPDAPRELRELVRTNKVRAYRVLVEESGGMVAQTEHTVVVTDDGKEIVTQ